MQKLAEELQTTDSLFVIKIGEQSYVSVCSTKMVNTLSTILTLNSVYDLKGIYLNRVMRKPTFWFSTWSDTNKAVQLQNMARGLKFRI